VFFEKLRIIAADSSAPIKSCGQHNLFLWTSYRLFLLMRHLTTNNL